MMTGPFIYAVAAMGFYSRTNRFWAAFVWPWYLGALLGAVLSEKGISLSVKSSGPVTIKSTGAAAIRNMGGEG